MKTKRSKPKTTVVSDQKQAEAAMLELAGLSRQIMGIGIDAQDRIDSIKKNAKDEMEPHQGRKKALEDALCTYATLNKNQLFSKRRSCETPFGVFGWRKATKLLTIAKMNLNMVLERLRELNIREAIKVKESVDKTAMQGWPDSRLESVGMKRVTTDEFFVEVADESLGEDV